MGNNDFLHPCGVPEISNHTQDLTVCRNDGRGEPGSDSPVCRTGPGSILVHPQKPDDDSSHSSGEW